MAAGLDSELVLSFDRSALERCYLVAEILEERWNEPLVEYGLLGLSKLSSPFRVVATLLLPGQHVTPASVIQSGHNVLRLRREIELLSRRTGQRLAPVVFVHRHRRSCRASTTDHAFLTGVFIDQVSTVLSFDRSRAIPAGDRWCDCRDVACSSREPDCGKQDLGRARIEYAVAFSLIVNQNREHCIYAVRKDTCMMCGQSTVRYVPARLAPDPQRVTSCHRCDSLRKSLEAEIEAKIRVRREAAAGTIQP